MEAWSGVPLTGVTATGNLTQLYPTWFTAGSAATTAGALRRGPVEGTLYSAQVETDGADGGTIQIWDINGADIGADVNLSTTITNAQLVALQAAGRAKLIFEQNFLGTAGGRTASGPGRPFVHGLAARFIASAGTCKLDMVVDGGARLTQIVG